MASISVAHRAAVAQGALKLRRRLVESGIPAERVGVKVGLAEVGDLEGSAIITQEGPASIIGYCVDLPAIGEGRMVDRGQAIVACVRAQGGLGLEGTAVLAYSARTWAAMTWTGGVWLVESGRYEGGEAWTVGVYTGIAAAWNALEEVCV